MLCLMMTLSFSLYLSMTYRIAIKHKLALGVLVWAVTCMHYLEFIEMGLPISAVRYEDLIATPVESMRNILAFCNLNASLADGCARALEYDSQDKTPLSSKVLQRHVAPEYVGAEKDETDAICDKFGVPRFDGAPFIAPRTITVPAPGARRQDISSMDAKL